LLVLALSRGAEPAPAARLLSPSEAIIFAAADAAAMPAYDAKQTRWLFIPNVPVKDRPTWRDVLNGHCNSLSKEPGLEQLRPLKDSGGMMFALRLDWYGWTFEQWEKFATSDYTFSSIVVSEAQATKQVITEEIEHWPGGVDKDGKFWAAGDYRVQKISVVPDGKKTVTKTRAFAPWLARDAASKAAVTQLGLLTGSQAPVVNASVFFDNTASSGDGRDPGYYGMLGVKNQTDWLKLVGVKDVKDSADFSGDLLAAVGQSGVTQEARVIQRLDKIGGAVWSSFDVNRGEAKDQKDPLAIIGSTDGKPALEFDATEKIAHLPSGMMVYLLANSKGVLQDRAPDTIAHDATPILRNRHQVMIGVSCVRCHNDGALQDLTDWWRNFPPELNPLFGDREGKKYDPDDYRRLRRSYVRKLEPFLKGDRDRYAAALKEACGLEPKAYAESYSAVWAYSADAQVDIAYAVRELGCTEAAFTASIRQQVALGKAHPTLAQFLLPDPKPPAPPRRIAISLTAWRSVYSLAQSYLAEAPVK
jgi:hypothetical protein